MPAVFRNKPLEESFQDQLNSEGSLRSVDPRDYCSSTSSTSSTFPIRIPKQCRYSTTANTKPPQRHFKSSGHHSILPTGLPCEKAGCIPLTAPPLLYQNRLQGQAFQPSFPRQLKQQERQLSQSTPPHPPFHYPSFTTTSSILMVHGYPHDRNTNTKSTQMYNYDHYPASQHYQHPYGLNNVGNPTLSINNYTTNDRSYLDTFGSSFTYAINYIRNIDNHVNQCIPSMQTSPSLTSCINPIPGSPTIPLQSIPPFQDISTLPPMCLSIPSISYNEPKHSGNINMCIGIPVDTTVGKRKRTRRGCRGGKNRQRYNKGPSNNLSIETTEEEIMKNDDTSGNGLANPIVINDECQKEPTTDNLSVRYQDFLWFNLTLFLFCRMLFFLS